MFPWCEISHFDLSQLNVFSYLKVVPEQNDLILPFLESNLVSNKLVCKHPYKKVLKMPLDFFWYVLKLQMWNVNLFNVCAQIHFPFKD